MLFRFFLFLGIYRHVLTSESNHTRVDFYEEYCSGLCEICDDNNIYCDQLNLTEFRFTFFKNESKNLEYFTLTNNQIGHLTEPIFDQKMHKLQSINLANNYIESIDSDKVFENLPSLTELILDGNNIKSFSTLGNLSNLKVLRVANSDIDYFNLDILCTLPMLENLILNNNFIDDLKSYSECFKNIQTSNLIHINLENNRLINPSVHFLQTLKFLSTKNSNFKVKLEHIVGFRCDCTLYNFHSFLNSHDGIIIDKQKLECDHRDSFVINQGKKVLDSKFPYNCGDQTTTTANPTTTTNRIFIRITTLDPRYQYRAYSVNRLFMFLFSVLLLCTFIMCCMKINLRKHIRNRSLFLYNVLHNSRKSENENERTFDDETTFNSNVVEGARLKFETTTPSTSVKKSEEFEDFDDESVVLNLSSGNVGKSSKIRNFFQGLTSRGMKEHISYNQIGGPRSSNRPISSGLQSHKRSLSNILKSKRTKLEVKSYINSDDEDVSDNERIIYRDQLTESINPKKKKESPQDKLPVDILATRFT